MCPGGFWTELGRLSATLTRLSSLSFQLWNVWELFCVCGDPSEDQPAEVPERLEHPRLQLHGLLRVQREPGSEETGTPALTCSSIISAPNSPHVCFADLVSHRQERSWRVHWCEVQRGRHRHVSPHQHFRRPGLHRFRPVLVEGVRGDVIPGRLALQFIIRLVLFSSLQFWVCLQLPVVGQPQSQLGRGEEGGHDGAAARGPQIRHPPGCPQGQSRVSIFRRLQECCGTAVVLLSNGQLDAGGTGEEPGQPALHHRNGHDALRWDRLAGARGAFLWTQARWERDRRSKLSKK